MAERATAGSQRTMSEQAQKQTLIIRALRECNGITQLARCPLPGPGSGRKDGLDGSLLRKLTLLVVAAARSLRNWPFLNASPSSAHGTRRRRRRRGGDSRMRIPSEPGRRGRRGAEVLRRSFRPEARFARPDTAPRRASAERQRLHAKGRGCRPSVPGLLARARNRLDGIGPPDPRRPGALTSPVRPGAWPARRMHAQRSRAQRCRPRRGACGRGEAAVATKTWPVCDRGGCAACNFHSSSSTKK